MAEEVEWSKVSLSTRPCVVASAMGPEEHRERITGQADIKDEVVTPGLDVWYIDIEEQTVLITAFMKTPVVQPSKRQVHFCLKKLNVLILFPNQPEDRRRRSLQWHP